MRLRHVLAASLLTALMSIPGVLGAEAVTPVPPKTDCPATGNPGKPLAATPWFDTQLDLTSLSAINQGQYVRSGRFGGMPFGAGDPVRVAVIDSGLVTDDGRVPARPNPVFDGADTAPTHQVRRWQFGDCVGHGTAVSSLIVGQPGRSRLVGIAPKVRLIPIQYTNVEDGGKEPDLRAALTYAIALRPRVINMSLQLTNRPGSDIMDLLRTAERDRIIIVAAGGNDNSQDNGAVYPAALSDEFNNIIAVSAVGQDGVAADFGITGSYVDVAAPGVKLPVALRYGGAEAAASGTSYAAPFVTGTVALLLATHPDMTPPAVRNRLEATADPPPGDQPNSQYGWGAVNPLQAVTSERDDVLATPAAPSGRPLAAPQPVAAPDRSLQHRAVAFALVLLGLAALTVTGAAVLRGSKRVPGRRS